MAWFSRKRTSDFRERLGEKRPFPGLSAAPTLLGHSAFALGMALLRHLEGCARSTWYDGSTSTAIVKEI
jgi:hypothetical protein